MFGKRQQQVAVQTIVTDLEDRSCAWCNAEQGLPQGNGSHGICEQHSQTWLTAAKETLRLRKERAR